MRDRGSQPIRLDEDRTLQSHRHPELPSDVIAQAIRVADGNHSLLPGALGIVAIRALHEAGYTLMRPVCEACEDA